MLLSGYDQQSWNTEHTAAREDRVDALLDGVASFQGSEGVCRGTWPPRVVAGLESLWILLNLSF